MIDARPNFRYWETFSQKMETGSANLNDLHEYLGEMAMVWNFCLLGGTENDGIRTELDAGSISVLKADPYKLALWCLEKAVDSSRNVVFLFRDDQGKFNEAKNYLRLASNAFSGIESRFPGVVDFVESQLQAATTKQGRASYDDFDRVIREDIWSSRG